MVRRFKFIHCEKRTMQEQIKFEKRADKSKKYFGIHADFRKIS